MIAFRSEKILLILLILTLPLCLIGALPSITELLPVGVRLGVGLLVYTTGRGDSPSLAPRRAGRDHEGPVDASPAAASPTLRVEFLALLPSLPGGGPAKATVLSRLALAAASPRSLAGLKYWSASRGRMRTLYSETYRVSSRQDRKPVPDPLEISDLGGNPPWSMYTWLKDLSFGGNLYGFDISMDSDEVRLEIVNLETVRYFLLPIAKAGAMKTRIEALPCAEGILVHLWSVLEAPGFVAERVFESAGNKGLAVLGWFSGKASALGLASSLVIPLKVEEALRLAGLP